MSEQALKLGDVVRLKSGGFPMTVCSTEDDFIICRWAKDGDYETLPFPPETLKIYEPEECQDAAD